MHTTQVISYLHGLPDNTWQEPNPDEPLSLVDQVLWTSSSDAVKTLEIPNKSLLSFEILKQVELALAYKCTDKIGNERLVQYIHYNRKANALRIDAMGKGNLAVPSSKACSEQERQLRC